MKKTNYQPAFGSGDGVCSPVAYKENENRVYENIYTYVYRYSAMENWNGFCGPMETERRHEQSWATPRKDILHVDWIGSSNSI